MAKKNVKKKTPKKAVTQAQNPTQKPTSEVTPPQVQPKKKTPLKAKIKAKIENNMSFMVVFLIFFMAGMCFIVFAGTAWPFIDVLDQLAMGMPQLDMFAATWIQLLTCILCLALFGLWIMWVWMFKPLTAYGMIRAHMKGDSNAININQQPSTRGFVYAATEEINGAISSQGIDRMSTPRSAIIIGGIPCYITYGDGEFTAPPQMAAAATELVEQGVTRDLAFEAGKSEEHGDIEIPIGHRTIRFSDFYTFNREMSSGVATERIAQERERKLIKKLGNPFNNAYQLLTIIALGAFLVFAIYALYDLFIGSTQTDTMTVVAQSAGASL